MLYTRITKVALFFSAFALGDIAEFLAESRHWIALMAIAVLGSFLCQFLLDLYFHVRLKEYEIEARKEFVAAIWDRNS